MEMMVLPSLTTTMWKEQFGRVLPEAMACGIPVIGSSSGEIPAVIGDAGLVFPEGNVESLRNCIVSLIDDPEKRRALGDAGIVRVREHFTSEQIAAELREFIRETASS
jgi:glycosyltransferase involved in cell wall biosynthesis